MICCTSCLAVPLSMSTTWPTRKSAELVTDMTLSPLRAGLDIDVDATAAGTDVDVEAPGAGAGVESTNIFSVFLSRSAVKYPFMGGEPSNCTMMFLPNIGLSLLKFGVAPFSIEMTVPLSPFNKGRGFHCGAGTKAST